MRSADERGQGDRPEARSEIEPLMREVGVTSEPEVTFWRKLESHDEVGWDA